MAKMIPSQFDERTVSPGERELFNLIRDDPATADWVVLHSLLLREHVEQVSGEADFVVIIPEVGVLIIEVKACRKLRISDDGLWFYGNSRTGDARGAPRQAEANMQSLISFLRADNTEGVSLNGVPLWFAVYFPYLEFGIRSEEWFPWQIVDSRASDRGSVVTDILNVMARGRQHLERKGGPYIATGSPTPAQVEKLKKVLRPRFEQTESHRQRRLRRTRELTSFTEEQYDALDSMERNDRVIFSGPAGTGKTFLALEAAKRASRSGRRVMLVCFNKALGHWLQEQAVWRKEGDFVGTLSSYMLKVAQLAPSDIQDDQHFWNAFLPDAAADRLVGESALGSFDELIIDEAQDILRGTFLDVLDFSLKGELRAGTWKMFGDFERQAIFGEPLGLEGFKASLGSEVSEYGLRVNCRNTPRIAEFVRLLAGLSPFYRRIRRPDDGVDPDLLYYAAGQEGEPAEALQRQLQLYFDEGYRGRDIVILSASRRQPLAATIVHPPWSDRLQPLETGAGGTIPYCTIHSFKGLEAPVIIVTDLDEIDSAMSQSLLYIAVTRALERLCIMLPLSMSPLIVERLNKALEENRDAI